MALHSKDHPFSAESKRNCCHGLIVHEGFVGVCNSPLYQFIPLIFLVMSAAGGASTLLLSLHSKSSNLKASLSSLASFKTAFLLLVLHVRSLLTSSIRISGSVCHVPLGFCCIYEVSEVILERIQDQFFAFVGTVYHSMARCFLKT